MPDYNYNALDININHGVLWSPKLTWLSGIWAGNSYRSALRSRSEPFLKVRSPLGSRCFWPAPLRFPLRSHALVASLHVGYTMPILFTYCILLSVYVDGSYIRVLEEVLSSLCSSKLLDSSCPSVSSLHLTNPWVHFVSYNGFTQSN